MEQARFSTFAADGRVMVAAPPRAMDQRMTPIYVALLLEWAALLMAMPLTSLTMDALLVGMFLLTCGTFIWTAVCLRLRGFIRTAAYIEMWTLLTLSCLTGILATYVVARLAAPLADSWMAAADHSIAPGLDWRETVMAITRHPMLIHYANRAYSSIQWQGSALILLCSVMGRTDQGIAFLLRWMIALALVCTIFAFLPCLGPYAHYGITHADVPGVGSSIGWRQPEILASLRGEAHIRLDPSALDGIVEFPSFHTAAAILFAWGYWGISWARWPMLALNLAMIAASIPIGGHYYIDVVAGAIVAWMAIKAPDWAAKANARLSVGRHAFA